jgi:hypothetical protein
VQQEPVDELQRVHARDLPPPLVAIVLVRRTRPRRTWMSLRAFSFLLVPPGATTRVLLPSNPQF